MRKTQYPSDVRREQLEQLEQLEQIKLGNRSTLQARQSGNNLRIPHGCWR